MTDWVIKGLTSHHAYVVSFVKDNWSLREKKVLTEFKKGQTQFTSPSPQEQFNWHSFYSLIQQTLVHLLPRRACQSGPPPGSWHQHLHPCAPTTCPAICHGPWIPCCPGNCRQHLPVRLVCVCCVLQPICIPARCGGDHGWSEAGVDLWTTRSELQKMVQCFCSV